MKAMALFVPLVPSDAQHPIYCRLLQPQNAPERAVLEAWARGMPDRDGKFVKEFQTTFESGLWELYLHACLKAWGHRIDFTHASPDFTVTAPTPYLLEATIAAPERGGQPAFGDGPPTLPDDFNKFNRLATLRVCNSFTSKVRRYREYYRSLPDAAGKPFVIAIAPFDRPAAHLASNRPIVAALYGDYYDEEATIAGLDERVVHERVQTVIKDSGVEVPVGLFTDARFADVSAVIYGPLATWGKLCALSHAPGRESVFTTMHPNPDSLYPEVRRAAKADYVEDLFDGLYVLHNPYANQPLDETVFDHPRVGQFTKGDDGALYSLAPDDFLLMRLIETTVRR